MAETHELRLKINAAAARAGAREFVAAINSIKTAIRQLDRDSDGVFTKLKRNLQDAARGGRVKLNIVDRTSLRNLESYARLAQQAIRTTGNTSRSVSNLTSRMSELSGAYTSARMQADAYTASVNRLNTALSRQTAATGRAATPRATTTSAGPTDGGMAAASSRGAQQAVVDQERVQRAVEATRLSVERLTTQLMRIGGFQTINELGRAFRDFQRQAASGTQSTEEFARAQNAMRSAISGATTSLTTLNAKARDQARAEREAAAATRERERAMMASVNAMRSAETETARLTNRLRAVGDVRGVEQLNQAMIRFRNQMAAASGSTTAVRNAVMAFNGVTNQLKINLIGVEGANSRVARSAAEMARQKSAAAAEARRLERDMRSAAGAANAAERAFRGATGGMRGLENAFSGSFQAASLFRTALGSITLGTFTQSVFRAGDALQQFSITMEVASGSAEAAAEDLAFINDMSARLGTNLSASRDAFAKFAVSSSIAGVSADTTKDIFESVSTAMAVLGKGTEDQRLAFLALEQMMSKGVISAEELRRQLGERLPGAVNLMAKAVGVSTSELQDMLKAGELISSEVLPKFAQELNKTFGNQLDRTFNRAGSNLGRLQNEFQKVLEIIANSGFLDTLSRQFRDLTSLMRSSEVREAAQRLGEGLADAAEIAGNAVQFLIQNIEQVAEVVKNLIGAVVIAQIARMGQAILLSGQQLLVAIHAFKALGAASTVATAQVAATGAAASRSAAQVSLLGSALTGATLAGGRLGAGLGVIARGLGILGGPLGIAFAALTIVPSLFNAISGSADETSREYERAMRAMGAASFSFIDTAREVEKATRFEQLQENIAAIGLARAEIAALFGQRNIAENFDGAFENLLSAAGPAFETQLQGLRTAWETFQTAVSDPDNDLADTAKKLKELKDVMGTLKTQLSLSGEGFKELRDVENIILPAAQAFLTVEEATRRSNDISVVATRQMLELSEAQAKVANEIDLLIGGVYAYNGATEGMSKTTLDAIASIDGMANAHLGLQGMIGNTDAAMRQFDSGGIRANEQSARDLSFAMQTLMLDFQGTRAEIEQLVSILQAQKQIAEQVAATARNSGERERAARAAESADAALRLAEALLAAKDASDELAGSANASASAINAQGGAMSATASQAYDYAAALRTIADAEREVAGIRSASTDTREARLAIARLRETDPRAAAQMQETTFGETSRIVADLNEQLEVTNRKIEEMAGASVTDGRFNAALAARARIQAEINAETQAGAAAAGELYDLQNRRRSGGGGGGGSSKEELSALEKLIEAGREHVKSLEAQDHANRLLASGMTTSAEAARMLGEAYADGVTMTDQQTMAFISQIEAAEKLNDALAQLANDPVNDWMNSVASWREAGQAIETQVFESLGDQISKFIQTGEFSFEELGASILATAADIISDMAVKEMVSLFGGNVSGTGEGGFGLGGIFSNMFANNSIGQPEGDPLAAGFNGQAAGQQIMSAMTQGGQQAAAAIQQAMSTAAGQISSGVQAGGAGAGAQISSQMTTGGSSAGTTIQTSMAQGGATAATQIGSAMQTSSVAGGINLGAGVEQGSMQGGNIFSQIFGGLFGGGGGGGIGGLFGMILPALFGSGGGVVGGGGPAIPQVMAPAGMFKNAPRFAMGTPNVSGGVPAVLHDNEAVVPLTGGRKIPVEMGGSGSGGGNTVVQNFNITTPDADSFRKSQSQIAADAASAGQRALSRNR